MRPGVLGLLGGGQARRRLWADTALSGRAVSSLRLSRLLTPWRSRPLLQVRRWGEQMAALRQAAPDADRQWLAANTKRCPRCQAHIQVGGGGTAG